MPPAWPLAFCRNEPNTPAPVRPLRPKAGSELAGQGDRPPSVSSNDRQGRLGRWPIRSTVPGAAEAVACGLPRDEPASACDKLGVAIQRSLSGGMRAEEGGFALEPSEAGARTLITLRAAACPAARPGSPHQTQPSLLVPCGIADFASAQVRAPQAGALRWKRTPPAASRISSARARHLLTAATTGTAPEPARASGRPPKTRPCAARWRSSASGAGRPSRSGFQGETTCSASRGESAQLPSFPARPRRPSPPSACPACAWRRCEARFLPARAGARERAWAAQAGRAPVCRHERPRGAGAAGSPVDGNARRFARAAATAPQRPCAMQAPVPPAPGPCRPASVPWECGGRVAGAGSGWRWAPRSCQVSAAVAAVGFRGSPELAARACLVGTAAPTSFRLRAPFRALPLAAPRLQVAQGLAARPEEGALEPRGGRDPQI